jgi:hypothetical protein
MGPADLGEPRLKPTVSNHIRPTELMIDDAFVNQQRKRTLRIQEIACNRKTAIPKAPVAAGRPPVGWLVQRLQPFG